MKSATSIKFFKSLVTFVLLLTSFELTNQNSHAHSFQTNLYPDIELKSDHLVIELWIASFLFPPFEDIKIWRQYSQTYLRKCWQQCYRFF